MSEKDVVSGFERLGISPSQYPKYTNAESFASGFKKCSVLKEVSITYTPSSGTCTKKSAERSLTNAGLETSSC